jgi:undecaprenyl-diphosphatase
VPPAALSRTATWASAGVGAAFLSVFLKLSQELFLDVEPASRVRSFDGLLLSLEVHRRPGWLTGIAIDLTALGSPVVLGIFVAMVVLVLAMTRDRAGSLLVVISALGAAGWTLVLKHLIERRRPPVSGHLVAVTGYSYPSGHSLASAAILMSGAIIACRHLDSRAQQLVVLACTLAVVSAVALSRVYLGVHYPSDVAAGTSLGLAWAFLSAAALSFVEGRRSARAGRG